MPDDDAAAVPAASPVEPAGPRREMAGETGSSRRDGYDGGGGDESRVPPHEVDLGIVDSLAQLSFVVQGELGKVAAEHGLSVIQLRVLGVLRDREPGMQELARHLGLDKSSMTGLIDRAERRGLVRRAPSPHDRRGVRVSLTREGHELARVLAADADRRIHALTAGLTDAQRSQLSLLASALVTGLTTI